MRQETYWRLMIEALMLILSRSILGCGVIRVQQIARHRLLRTSCVPLAIICLAGSNAIASGDIPIDAGLSGPFGDAVRGFFSKQTILALCGLGVVSFVVIAALGLRDRLVKISAGVGILLMVVLAIAQFWAVNYLSSDPDKLAKQLIETAEASTLQQPRKLIGAVYGPESAVWHWAVSSRFLARQRLQSLILKYTSKDEDADKSIRSMIRSLESSEASQVQGFGDLACSVRVLAWSTYAATWGKGKVPTDDQARFTVHHAEDILRSLDELGESKPLTFPKDTDACKLSDAIEARLGK